MRRNKKRRAQYSRRDEQIATFSSIAELDELIESGDLEVDENADPVQVENELFQLVSENIDADEENGLIDAGEAEELRADLIDEHAARLEALLQVDAEGYLPGDDDEEDEDEDEDEDDEQYSGFTDLATFASVVEADASDWTASLLEVAAGMGYKDVESLVVDIANTLGLEDEIEAEEIALDLVTGELIPDDELVAVLADGLNLDDNEYGYIADAAATERAVLGDEELDEEAVEAAQYSRHQNRRVEVLENQIAEFHAQQAVSDALSQCERMIDDGIAGGWMPPYAKELLMGSFDRESDRVAAFSQVCASNGVDVDSELYALERVIATFQRCFEGSPIAMFGSQIEDAISPQEEMHDEDVWAQAQANHALRMGRVATKSR